MKTIIAGSRSIVDFAIVEQAIKDSGFDITEVVCGGANGVDSLGKLWATQHNIPVKMFMAAWDTYGSSAGYKRNVQMSGYAEALIAVWDKTRSKGTGHMIDIANRNGLKVFVKKL